MPISLTEGNRLTLLNSGAAYFPALIQAINKARSHILLETYLYADDPSGQAVTQALIRAARRGVIVRVLVDGFGARDFPTTFMPILAAEGIQALIYRPELAPFRLRRHRLRRLHRKLAVMDGRYAFVGGINIIDDLNTPHQIPPRFDFAVKIEGPLLAPIQQAMCRLWNIVVLANFRQRKLTFDQFPLRLNMAGKQQAAFIQRNNLRHRRAIEDAYLEAIDQAKHDILLANAYFLPGHRFRRALRDAARRGVHVRILLQGRVEYPLLHYASQALYRSLLLAGIHLFEYHKSFLHAKVAVIDGHWATVGSSNIDPFSLFMSKEANVVVQDATFAQTLQSELQEAIDSGAHQLHATQWIQMPLLSRLIRWISYQSIRLMMGLAGIEPGERKKRGQ